MRYFSFFNDLRYHNYTVSYAYYGYIQTLNVIFMFLQDKILNETDINKDKTVENKY